MKYSKLLSLAACVLIFVPLLMAGCSSGGGDNPVNLTQPNTTPATQPPPSTVTAIDFAINQIETDCSEVGVTKVTVYASVIDQNGDPITELTNSNFSLFENSAPIDSNTVEVNFVDQLQIPVSVALLMDYSTSMLTANAIEKMKDAIIGFVNQLNPNDRGEVIKFAQLVDKTQAFTDDKTALINAVNVLPWPQNWFTESALYDAMEVAIEDAALEPNRKAVVVITDGWDNNSTIGIDDLIDLAKSKNVPLFIIGFDNPLNKDSDSDELFLDIDSLTRIVEETGGHFYLTESTDEFYTIYQQIADILIFDQYVIKYTSLFHGSVDVTLEIDVEYNGLTDSDSRQFTTCPN
jgi:VWFA-related protein